MKNVFIPGAGTWFLFVGTASAPPTPFQQRMERTQKRTSSYGHLKSFNFVEVALFARSGPSNIGQLQCLGCFSLPRVSRSTRFGILPHGWKTITLATHWFLLRNGFVSGSSRFGVGASLCCLSRCWKQVHSLTLMAPRADKARMSAAPPAQPKSW